MKKDIRLIERQIISEIDNPNLYYNLAEDDKLVFMRFLKKVLFVNAYHLTYQAT